jgi:enoyl-[acyl-carrier protein] reductase I
MQGLMHGKRGLIMGVANDHSIAWGIARTLAAHGAKLAFTYHGEALGKRVKPLAASVNSDFVLSCDVEDIASVDAVFAEIARNWGSLDFLVHAVAFSDKTQLTGRFADTTRDNFLRTMLISCFAFVEAAKRAAAVMPDGGAMLTLTYNGGDRAMPNYNAMGPAKAALEASVRYLAIDFGGQAIRVNAISAGPIKTLAASGIGDFRYILNWNEHNAPLRRNITADEVGDTAVYLLSDMARGVTGEIHHVDAGYHIVGMKHPDAPDLTVGRE